MNAKEFKATILSLTDRIYPMVARMLGNTESTEDAVQEIMIKLWEKRYQLAKHPNKSGYVFLVARNYCLDILKSNKTIKANYQNPQINAQYIPENNLEWEELKKIVENILNTLPEQQSEILTLRDLDGLEFNEIATVTGLKVEHIRVLVSRARKQVAFKLKNVYDYDGKK